MPARILASDEKRQLERLGEADPSDLLGRRLGNERVAVHERPAEDRVGTALRGRRSSSPGPGRPSQSKEQLAGSSLLGEDTTRQCRLEKEPAPVAGGRIGWRVRRPALPHRSTLRRVSCARSPGKYPLFAAFLASICEQMGWNLSASA